VIIGVGHAAQVGKDSFGAACVKYHGFKRLAFADALKDLVYDTDRGVRHIVDRIGWEAAKAAYPLRVRQGLVDVGLAARKHLGADVWLNAVAQQIDHDDPAIDYVITDVRYPNELAWILNAGGIAVKINRPGYGALDDVADRALADTVAWSVEIDNAGTLDDLAIEAGSIVASIRISKGLDAYSKG
jgi:hypothetical protein